MVQWEQLVGEGLEKKIELDSQDFYLEVLRTFPLWSKIEEGKFEFYANGIKSPNFNEENGHYINQCRENGIIPFSSIEFDFNAIQGFVSPSQVMIEWPYGHSANDIKQDVHDIHRGKRISYQEFCFGDRGFQELVTENLPCLLEGGYLIGSGECSILYDNGSVLLEIDNGLKLEIEDEEFMFGDKPSEEALKLLSWFDRLHGKYIRGQSELF